MSDIEGVVGPPRLGRLEKQRMEVENRMKGTVKDSRCKTYLCSSWFCSISPIFCASACNVLL